MNEYLTRSSFVTPPWLFPLWQCRSDRASSCAWTGRLSDGWPIRLQFSGGEFEFEFLLTCPGIHKPFGELKLAALPIFACIKRIESKLWKWIQVSLLQMKFLDSYHNGGAESRKWPIWAFLCTIWSKSLDRSLIYGVQKFSWLSKMTILRIMALHLG